jgi:desampylase
MISAGFMLEHWRMAIMVTSEVLAALDAAARAAHPSEACGILLGEHAPPDERITAIMPAANIHPDPATHFEIDPQTLIAAHRTARAGGLLVAGYYHSHPTGPAAPSATDQALAARDGRIWAIIASNGDIGIWRDGPDGFAALSFARIES